jgi:UDP-N-acetylmuramyl pentapeptide phosphotransferase/UDP-N-acetylglucosamine-1-phosphate transferase
MAILLLSILSFLLALSLTAASIGYLRQRFLDIPNQRSSHQKPVPRGGGVGFILAFALSGAVANIWHYFDRETLMSIDLIDFGKIWLVLLPLIIVGSIDDRQDLSAAIRYLVQLMTAVMIVLCFGVIPLSLSFPLATIFSIVVSLIAITATINFYNFMDGLDGLVAGVTAVQLTFIAIYLQQPIFLLLAAALIGFLCWNWSPAKVFMGDVGSTVLGATVAIALLHASQKPTTAWTAFTVVLPLIGDAVYTLIRRLVKKENIFQAHRVHLYQRLQQSGWSHDRVALTYMLLTAILGVIVIWLEAISIPINLVLTVVAICGGEFYLYYRQAHSK